MLEIERKTLFRAAEPDEMRRHALNGFVVAAREIANFGPLNLDHASAEVRKLTCGKRSSHRMLQSNYRNAVEWSHTNAVNDKRLLF